MTDLQKQGRRMTAQPPDDGAKHLVVVSILVSIVFSLLLGIGLGLVGSKAVSAGREAKAAAAANAAAIHDSCVSANKTRTLNIELWTYVLSLAVTPEDHDNGAKLLDFVRERNAQVSCL